MTDAHADATAGSSAGRRFVSVLRSSRRDGMYLYVDRSDGLKQVPDVLKTVFGQPVHAMDLLLTADRRLARVAAADVLAAIAAQGFYLQMPPGADEEMNSIILANDKLAPNR